jgi:ferredoxin
MRCARSSREVPVAAGQSLLDAAEAGGVAIDSLCRAGVCGTCRTRVMEGDVHCESTALDDNDREQGYVLACVARAESDCVVEV